MWNSMNNNNDPQRPPTFLDVRRAIIDGIEREYRRNPTDEKTTVALMSQAAALSKLIGESPTEYLRNCISGLTRAGAPRRVIVAVTNYYMEVIHSEAE